MWMKITQNSAPGIGKAPLPGKTKDPQEPAIAGQLSFCWLDNRLIPRCDFLWNVYHFKLQSISAYQILFLDPSLALSERIQHGHHFFSPGFCRFGGMHRHEWLFSFRCTSLMNLQPSDHLHLCHPWAGQSTAPGLRKAIMSKIGI